MDSIDEIEERTREETEPGGLSGMAVWQGEPAGLLTAVSPEIEALTGFPPRMFLSEPQFKASLVHCDDKERLLCAIRSATPANNRIDVVYRFQHADGRWLHLRDIATVFFSQSRPATLVGVTVPVPEERKSESSLRLFCDIVAKTCDCGDLEPILAYAVRRICESSGWLAAQVWFPHGAQQQLIPRFATRYVRPGCDLEFGSGAFVAAKGEGLIGKAWQAMRPLSALRDDSDFSPYVAASLGRNGIGSVIAVPALYRDQVHAVLEFYCQVGKDCDQDRLDSIFRVCRYLGRYLEESARGIMRESPLSGCQWETQILLDLITAQVFYKDTNNRILRLNKAAADASGYSVAEMEGRHASEFYPADAEMFYKDDLDVIASGAPKLGIVLQIQTKSGAKRWVRADKIPVKAPDGSVSGIVVFAVDITQDKNKQSQLLQDRRELQSKIEQRTQTLRDTESRLAQLSRLVPGVLYQYLVSKDGSEHFPYVSEGSKTVLGYSPEHFQSDPANAFNPIHDEDLPNLRKTTEESARNCSVFIFEARFKKASGDWIWVRMSSSPERLPSGDMLWNGILTDITDIKLAQEKIRQLNEDLEHRVSILAAVNRELELLTHKLEVSYDQAMEASRLKSQFVANISHEVRTPISAVIGMSEMLMETSLSDEQREFTVLVQESALSLLSIINDILDFSKMEAGKIELETIEFSPVPLVEGVAELLAISARERELSLMTYVDPLLPRCLEGDPVRLRQVLLNLTSNAIKFTERGEVLIRVSPAWQEEKKMNVRFEVIDTGIGLSEAVRKLLFQPFVQGDGSTSRKYGGTGLGLSISKRLVELMGGEMGVDSSPSQGSRFWFTVPLYYQRLPDQSLSIPLPRPIKVLIWERSRSSSFVLSKYLGQAGAICQLAQSEQDALDMLRRAGQEENQFNVVVVGIAEGTDRISEIPKLVARDANLSGTRLILISPFDDKGQAEAALAQGFSACLTKPIRQSVLIEAVTRVFSMPGEELQALPAAVTRSDKQAAPSASVNYGLFTDKPILVAEDNAVMQQLAVRRVRKLGLNACSVSNGKEVLAAMAKEEYALVLMDCQMPEMDGFEATAVIRSNEAALGRHTPIIAMTASAMVGDREHCIASGMDDYLSKPVSYEQLTEVLRKWLPEAAEPPETLTVLAPELVSGAEMKEVCPSVKVADAIDWALDIQRLEELYGKDDISSLLESFVAESQELGRAIELFAKERDGEKLALQLHQLRGLSAVVTANRLRAACLELELAVKRYAWREVDELIGPVREELALAVNFCKQSLVWSSGSA